MGSGAHGDETVRHGRDVPLPVDVGPVVFSGAPRPGLIEAVLVLGRAGDEAALLAATVAEVADLLRADAVVLGKFGLSGSVSELVSASAARSPARRDEAVATATHAYDGLLGVRAPAQLRGDASAWSTHPVDQRVPGNLAWLLWPVEVDGLVVARIHVMREPTDPFEAADLDVLALLVEAAEARLAQVRVDERRQRRLRSLEATASIAEVLAPPTRVDEGLAHVAQSAVGMTGASAVAVLQETASERPDIVAVAGREARTVPDLLFRIDPDLLRMTAETDVVFVPDGRGRLVVLVPLNAHLSFSGVLLCVIETDAGLRYDETEALGTFADQTALALDRAQAVSDRQELMLISDRDRIARDLHDVVIQRLFATGLRLQGLRRFVGDDRSRHRLDEAVTDLDLIISDIRGTIFDLQQPSGSEARDTVREIVREYIPLLGFTPTVRTSGPVDTVVGQDTLDQVAAVLRECLSNVMRHAGASAAVVELEAADHQVVLRVIDDGVGLPERPGRRSGLANMRVRAEALGGGSQARGGEHGGTVVEWWAPLADGVGGGDSADRAGSGAL